MAHHVSSPPGFTLHRFVEAAMIEKVQGKAQPLFQIPRRAVLRFDDIGIEVFKFFDRDTLCSMQFLGRAFRDFIDGLPNAALYTVPELRVIDDKYGGFEIRLSKEDGLGQFARFKLSRARDRLRHIWAASVSISTYDFRMTAKQFAIVCDVVRQVRPPDLHFVELDLAHSAYKKFAQIFANGFVKRIAFEQYTMSKKFDADSFVRMCARNGVLFIDFSASCLSDNDGEKAIAVTEDVILDFCFGREDISSREAVGLHVNLKENSSTFLRTFLEVTSSQSELIVTSILPFGTDVLASDVLAPDVLPPMLWHQQ